MIKSRYLLPLGIMILFVFLTSFGVISLPLNTLDKTSVANESNKDIEQSLGFAKEWFIHSTSLKTHRLEYEYSPTLDIYSSDNNHTRQLGTLWAVTELRVFLKDPSLDPLIKNTLDYYLQFRITQDDYSFVTIDNLSPLSYNAFLILSLLKTPEYPQADTILTQLGKGIVALQKDDGSFKTFFNSDRNTSVDYYPGEAMLALMKLYEKTQDQKYKTSVANAFSYYRNYWRNNKNTAFIPWQTQVYFLLYTTTKDPALADFVFEMNDWLIDNHQIQESANSEFIGGFPKDYPRNQSSSYLEGINDAYVLASMVGDENHKKKYGHSLKIGTKFILRTQATKNNVNYKNPKRAMGGFRYSLANDSQRIDYTQHAIMALLKAHKNNIFE